MTPAEIEAAAIARFGQPNGRLSTPRELRFGRKGSVSVVLDGDRAGLFFDFETWTGGALSGEIGRPRLIHPRPKPRRDRSRDTAYARRLYDSAGTAAGTPVERYLASRGLALPVDTLLRYHPACPDGGARRPAMVAPMLDALTGEFRSLHRTFLSADGRKLCKRAVGPAAGTAIPTRHAAVPLLTARTARRIAIAEGIEDALSVEQIGRGVCLAAYCAGAIRNLPVIPGAELHLFADPDDAGIEAARACARRWAAAGHSVRVHYPRVGDWNQTLIEEGVPA